MRSQREIDKYLAHVVFSINSDLSEADADRKLTEVENLVFSIYGVEAAVGEFYPED